MNNISAKANPAATMSFCHRPKKIAAEIVEETIENFMSDSLSVEPDNVGGVLGNPFDLAWFDHDVEVSQAIPDRVSMSVIINKTTRLHMLLKFCNGVNVVFVSRPATVAVGRRELDFFGVCHSSLQLFSMCVL